MLKTETSETPFSGFLEYVLDSWARTKKGGLTKPIEPPFPLDPPQDNVYHCE